MLGYVVRRLLGIIPTMFVLLFLVVLMVRLIPGDVVDLTLEEQIGTEVEREEMERRLGLDKSLPEQYIAYLSGIPRGDLGRSLWSRQPVAEMVVRPGIISLELATLALLLSTTIAIPLGVVSAVRQNSVWDYGLRSVALLAISIPNFALGTMVLVLPAIYFGWTPPLFFTPFTRDPAAHFSQFLIPAVLLGLALSGSMTRLTRTMMLEVLRQDYIRTANSKGLRRSIVIRRHALKNAIIPVLSLLGLQAAVLISGAVIVESIFALPGLGRLLLDSVRSRDYTVIQGISFLVGLWVMLVNLGIDIAYSFVDPRVRVGRSG